VRGNESDVYVSATASARTFFKSLTPGVFAAVLLACVLLAGSVCFAAEEASAPQEPVREELTIDTDLIAKPWTGDLDGMIERGVIRVLTAYSKTFYFVNKGAQHGVVYDAFRLFEDDLNKKLAKAKKLKHKHLKLRVVFVPVGRISCCRRWPPARAISLRPTSPLPRAPEAGGLFYPLLSQRQRTAGVRAGLARGGQRGRPGWKGDLRPQSSSFYESLTALNQRLASEKKAAVIIKEAPEALETEDLLEMVNAGLIQFTVADKHVADFWKQIFPNITVHEG